MLDSGKKHFNVINAKSGTSFFVEEGETVLSAALRQEIGLPWGCGKGNCGACRGELIAGSVFTGGDLVTSGEVLTCQCQPQEDITIKVREGKWRPQLTTKRLPARIANLDRIAPSTFSLRLQYPSRETFSWSPGQYIGIEADDGRLRYFSIADAIPEKNSFTLHINRLPNGAFTSRLGSEINTRDVLWFEGPFGGFSLNASHGKKAILIAGGTGYAPIRAGLLDMIQHEQTLTNVGTELHLYWGVSTQNDFYMLDDLQNIAQSLPALRVHLIPHHGAPDSLYPVRGFVHHAAMNDHPDMSDLQVFACGSPGLIAAAQSDFIKNCGLQENAYTYDSFDIPPQT